MVAAAITAVTVDETAPPGMEIVHGTLAATGDYYISKFGTITAVQCTPSVAQVCGVTWSGSTITIATAACDVNLIITGR